MGEREHGGTLRTVVVLSLISAIAATAVGASVAMADTNKSHQDGIVSKLKDVANDSNGNADRIGDASTSNYGYDYDERNLTATISRVTNRSAVQGKDIQIPAKVKHNGKTYTVTAIGDSAFMETDITGVTIPGTVKTIGMHAFANNNISSLTLPNSVNTIGIYAFAGNNISSLTLPRSLKSVGAFAFYYNNISSLTLPGSLKSIDTFAFCHNNISSLTLPNSLKSVGERAFDENKLTKGSVKGGRNLKSFYTSNDSSSFGTYQDGADVRAIKPAGAKASAGRDARTNDDGQGFDDNNMSTTHHTCL